MRLTNLFRSAVALALCLGLSLAARAQQEVCLSVHGGPATGQHNQGGPSSLNARIKINGVPDTTSVSPRAGQTAAQVSADQEAAFRAKGYDVVRKSPTEICLKSGPGGAPITAGVSYGNDDTGLDIDTGVRKLPPAVGGGGGGDPATKGEGGGIVVPPDNQPPAPLPQPVLILIVIEVRLDNGSVVVIVVQVMIFPGMNGLQIQQAILQALRQAGFLVNRGRWPSTFPGNQLVDGFLLDRHQNGGTVQHMQYQYDAMARRVLGRQEMTAGLFPTHGATSYGDATRGFAPATPFVRTQGEHRIGSFFDVTYQLHTPFLPGGELVSLGGLSQAQPVLNGWLLVDPWLGSFLFGMTDAFGNLSTRYVVPADPRLVGLPLHLQGVALDPVAGQVAATDALKAVIGS